MPRSDLYLKVEVDHEERERPEDLAAELCRALLKLYGVRSAELSSFVTHPDQ
jgi:hypothetical protein